MNLDIIVFGEYTLRQVLMVAGGIIALFVVWNFIKKFFKSEEEAAYTHKVRCPSCGWEGRVSTLKGRCPQCNADLSEK